MSDLIDTQAILYDSIVKLGINIKKDSADRKTVDYFKRKLSTLEKYWAEYKLNHERIELQVSKSDPYFTDREYEKTGAVYESTKGLINQQYQLRAMKTGNLTTGEQTTARDRSPSTTRMRQEEDASKEMEPSIARQLRDRPAQGSDTEPNSKLDELLKKQYANFKAFVRTTANIDVESIVDKWEFEDVLKLLQARWSAIDKLHWEIEIEHDGENDQYNNMYDKYETKFNNLKRAINTKMWSVAHREKSTPQIDIPNFNGNYNQWVSFRDLFTEVIHNNPSLSNGQKMQYLKGKVRGEAEKLIQHLSISTDNYLVSWNILTHRYNNKKLIFSSHMNVLLGLPNIQQQSLQQIKRMHDTTVECLNAIKNLGVDTTSWDPMIVHILGQKLDTETYTDYIESLKNSKELPVLGEFLEFLETKFTSLETVRRKDNVPLKTLSQNNGQTSYNYNKNNNSNNLRKNITNYGNRHIAKSLHMSNIKCPLCNNQHGIYNCKTYLKLSDEQKLKTANKLRLCTNCLFSHFGNACTSSLTCRKCQDQHNTLLHDAFSKLANASAPSSSGDNGVNTKRSEKRNESVSGNVNASQNETAEILLATALVKVKSVDGTYQTMRALIDQGSQISLITEEAAQLLGIQRRRCKGVIFGVGQKANNCKGKISIECASMYNNFEFDADVLIMNELINHLPNRTFDKPTWNYINNINLADPEFNKSRRIDLLFGADIYANIMLGGILKGEHVQQPIAQQTQLGWILCGNVKTYQCNVILNNIDEIRTFWEIEEISEPSNLSMEDQECMDYYIKTTRRNSQGRYEVRIPLKEHLKQELGSSKNIAIAQLKNLERRLEKQPTVAENYKEFMKEYAVLNHMQPEQENINVTLECFLPHHAVIKEDSSTTKLRVVFNASAKTTTKFSLNDIMLKGPNLQKDLQTLLLQWRQYPFALTADIEKMYRQISVNPVDQHLQKIVWRESSKQPIQVYQLNTVTYGTKAAPFLAIMTLKQLAEDERSKFPKEVAILENSFYMDDLLHGCYNIEEGKQCINNLMQLLKSGGFNLRKWSSNSEDLLANLSTEQENVVYSFKNDDMLKTLGLCWNPRGDQFTFRCNFSQSTTRPTKRNLLSEISKLYDPLGWLTPLSTKLKLLFQKLWKHDLHWDDKVSDDVYSEWTKLTSEIEQIKHCKIPRWILCNENDVIELHGYCDASIEAYACVVYARIKYRHDTTIVAAKSKLTPSKKSVTLPRMELCGAYLLSKLVGKIKQNMNCPVEIHGWCDSMVVIGWLQGDSARWKPFVANRVTAIKQMMPANCWRYVKSEDNPADCASRGLTAPQLLKHPLWWKGPSWLASFDVIKEEKQSSYHTDEESKIIKFVNIIQNMSDNNIINNLLLQHNCLQKITRVLAWVRRALTPKTQRQHLPSYLTLVELRQAKSAIVKQVQTTEFTSDIAHIKKHGNVATTSKIISLKPFIDDSGFLRVGGRLRNSTMSEEMKHPKIISNKGRLAELVIEEAHLLTFHGGPRLTLSTLRQQYWITSGYNTVKKQLRNCVTCRKYEARKQYQLMGDLPAARTNPAPPFYHTGVDYTGFVNIKANKGRSARTLKGYVALFICMVTKAVHLELVSDLTSSAFLAALKRMAARRGTPHNLYSDQGTNFIGANRLLQEEYNQIQQVFHDNCLVEIAEMNIQWHFNAPSWPNAGGLWERAVRSLKFHLKRVVGEQKLTFEEFTTVLTQLEACLNSRPLCSLTENIEDLDYLSPSHFLTGRADLTVIETKEDARTRWHLTNNIFKQIWHKWKLEYLSQLTAREKWTKPQENLNIGNMVVVHEDNIPAGKWIMGRIIDVHPGKDGYVRVVSLKTKNGIIKRPVVKLSLLPVESVSHGKQVTNTDESAEHKSAGTQNKNKQRKATIGTISYIALALTYFMSLCSVVNCRYNITALNDNQSFYFDPISKINLVKDTWTLVVFYNMSPYWEGMKAFEKVTTYLEKTCKSTGSEQCNMILPQLIHECNELKHYNGLLMTQHDTEHSRQRRGLINAVGNIANSLFGVLDQQFAEKYTRDDINLIQQNEKHLNELWKNQTSIVESEYNLLKRTEEIMSKQHKIINKHLITLENVSNKLQMEINNISLLQEFTMTALTASNLLHNLRRNQDTLLDMLTNVHNGQINIHLLTPEQLQRELNIISRHLSDDLTLPIEAREIRKLYALIHIKARITEEYFLFQITFPLISRDRYKLYKVQSIPHQINNSMIELIPSSEYIATDLKGDAYLTMTSAELAQCKEQDDMFLCNWKKPIYHLSNENNFCDRDRVTKECKLRRSTCENRWTPLANPSLFMYHCCNNYDVKIICEEQINKITLTNSGVFYLEPGCLLKGQDFTLNVQRSKKNMIDMSPDILIPAMDQLNFIVNNSMPFKYYEDVTDSGEIKNTLRTLHHRIADLKNSRVELNDTISTHDIHQYAVTYLVVIALALAAGTLLYRQLRRRARRANITSGMQLQPSTSVSEVNHVNVNSVSANNPVERQPRVTRSIVNRECPPSPV